MIYMYHFKFYVSLLYGIILLDHKDNFIFLKLIFKLHSYNVKLVFFNHFYLNIISLRNNWGKMTQSQYAYIHIISLQSYNSIFQRKSFLII